MNFRFRISDFRFGARASWLVAALSCAAFFSSCKKHTKSEGAAANQKSEIRNLKLPEHGIYTGAYIDWGEKEDSVGLEAIEAFDKMVGKHVMDFIHPDEVPRASEKIGLRERGVQETYQAKIRLLDGEERWLKISSSPMLDDEGRFMGSLAMMSDITDQTRIEQAMRDSQERFRTLAIHSPAGIFQCDRQGNSLFVNNRYATISGVRESEAAGRGWLKSLHPLDRDEILADLEHALECCEEFSRLPKCPMPGRSDGGIGVTIAAPTASIASRFP